MSNLIREWNGRTIRQRADGYLSATDMCQACGKLFGHFENWLYTDFAKGVLAALKFDTNLETEFYPHGILEIYCLSIEAAELAKLVNKWGIEIVFVSSYRKAFSNIVYTPDKALTDIVNSLDVGFVYFIRDTSSGMVKVGKSKNVWKRLKTLQNSTPGTLEILKTVATLSKSELESTFHKALKDYKVLGEWFLPFPYDTTRSKHENKVKSQINLLFSDCTAIPSPDTLDLLECKKSLYTICSDILQTGSASVAIRNYKKAFCKV